MRPHDEDDVDDNCDAHGGCDVMLWYIQHTLRVLKEEIQENFQ